MSINTSNSNSLNSDTILNQAVGQILGGYQPDALARLKKCGLYTNEQIEKIQATLQVLKPTHLNTTPQALKDRLLVALNPDVMAAETLPQSKIEHHCFTETPTCAFAIAYPCTIEFGGKCYQSGAACFLAQQYTDQPHVMELLSQCETAEEALLLSSKWPMTEELKLSWENPHAEHINKNDVMMHVQRAKFGQNPELKEKLLSLGSMHIVCKGNDSHLCDGLNGSGQNQLGISLMRLRREYGWQYVAPHLSQDNTLEIFNHCFSRDDIRGIQSLACTDKHFYTHVTKLVDIKFEKIRSEITIIDAEKQGSDVDDESPINKLALIKNFQDMALHVENNAGLTLLTMTKGLTLNQLVAIAEKAGIEVNVRWKKILEDVGDVPVEHTYRVVITNNVFIDSRRKTYEEQQDLVIKIRCEMPTVQEYVALCIFTSKIFNICLYGEAPLTYGRSSTWVVEYPLVVGGSAPGRLDVNFDFLFDYESSGAGGRRKF